MIKAKKFDELVDARAKERARNKIADFRSRIAQAFEYLTGDHHDCRYRTISNKASEILKVMIGENSYEGWPQWIFDKEKKKVQDELLGTMDEMQKAFLSLEKAKNASGDDDITFQEEKPEDKNESASN